MYSKRRIVLLLTLSLLSVSCSKLPDLSKKNASEEQEVGTAAALGKTSILAEDVRSSLGCLSLPKFYEAFQTLNQSLNTLQISTEFDMKSSGHIRREFKAVSAYAAFTSEWDALGELNLLSGFEQEGCQTVTHVSEDGVSENFKITNSAADSLTIESVSGKKITYQWMSPQSLKVKMTYTAYDYPCTATSATIDTSRIYDWSGVNFELISADGAYIPIDEAYLEIIADVTGYDHQALYSDISSSDPDAPSRHALRLANIIEMSHTPIKPEFLSCNGVVDEPERPQDPPNTDDGGDPVITPPAPTPDPIPAPTQPGDDDPSIPPRDDDGGSGTFLK